ncbi:MAG: CehA/McbA family metallohydrolase [Candidatus Scalinduaceae bacterium]
MMTVYQVAWAQSLQVYFGNLHSHTSYSDGSGTPEMAYTHARDIAGLDFLAITEHNHPRAPSRIATNHQLYSGSFPDSLISTAERFTQDGRFVAIYGQEFSSISSGNHANVFEVGAVIDTSDVPNGEWDDLLNTWLPSHLDSQGQPALILLNHPAQSSSPNDKEYGIDDFGSFTTWRTKLDAHAQLINIINGPSHDRPHPGQPSESEFLRYLNLGLHVAPTADQDNHRTNWGSAADTRTGVVTTSLTKSNILKALRARHVYATEDRNLQIIAKVNGELVGTRFQGNQVPNPGSELSIEIDLNDDDEPFALYTIDVYADHLGGPEEADVVAQFEASGNGTVTLDGISYDGGNQYFFFKITETDDDGVEVDRAWLAPVWFESDDTTGSVSGPALTLKVNLVTEEATITNVGGSEVNLRGWTLISVQGNQRFTFTRDVQLQPGQSVVVTSGPNAKDQLPDYVKWKMTHIWRNSGDPGQLLDPDERIRAETQ